MTSELTKEVLHLPDGINYECTGCGKCCGGWSVPMTDEDYLRISDVDWAAQSFKFEGMDLFRPLRKYESEGTPYTHAIKEGDDGRCPFLADNLCFIHSKFGSSAKPSICQLFPYCFSDTPSGVFATVSFISMGVVHNSGRPLADQKEYLEGKLKEFRELFPDHKPNWDKLQLATGRPISWQEYLQLEGKVLSFLKDDSESIDRRLLRGSAYLQKVMRSGGAEAAAAGGEAESGAEEVDIKYGALPMVDLDKHLLVALHKIYFPVKKLGRGEGDFGTFRFINQVLLGALIPPRIRVADKAYRFEDLKQAEYPERDKEIDDLLYRYFYSRIWAKLYFGAGYGQLSMIAGFHHLILIYALVKMQARALSLARGANKVSYVDMVAAVRQLEKRFGETALGGYAAATYELLMFSHNRVRRVLANC